MKTNWMVAIAFLAGSGAALAEGEFEIDQACVAVGCFPGDTAGFPVQLAANATYRLTSNLFADAGSGVNAVQIATTVFAEFDLGGFTIYGGGNCTGSPVSSCSGATAQHGIRKFGPGRVRIHNGSVHGMGGSGILMEAFEPGSSIENVLLTENANRGFTVDSSSDVLRIDRVRCVRNFNGCGVSGTTPPLHVMRSEFSYNSGDGLTMGLFGIVSDSAFIGNAGFGLVSSNPTSPLAMGRNVFFGNNGAPASAQYTSFAIRDMGGNVCGDGTCP